MRGFNWANWKEGHPPTPTPTPTPGTAQRHRQDIPHSEHQILPNKTLFRPFLCVQTLGSWTPAPTPKSIRLVQRRPISCPPSLVHPVSAAADKSGARQERINEQDHVSIYLELSQVHLRMKNVTAAQEIIQEAMSEFKRSKEEGRITIANAMVTAKRDVDQALGILRSVPPSSQYFLKAKAQMAHIYLHQRNNKRAFAKCYEELVEAYPSVSSYMFLGEAYMNIQEPEKAIAAFEKALAMVCAARCEAGAGAARAQVRGAPPNSPAPAPRRLHLPLNWAEGTALQRQSQRGTQWARVGSLERQGTCMYGHGAHLCNLKGNFFVFPHNFRLNVLGL